MQRQQRSGIRASPLKHRGLSGLIGVPITKTSPMCGFATWVPVVLAVALSTAPEMGRVFHQKGFGPDLGILHGTTRRVGECLCVAQALVNFML